MRDLTMDRARLGAWTVAAMGIAVGWGAACSSTGATSGASDGGTSGIDAGAQESGAASEAGGSDATPANEGAPPPAGDAAPADAGRGDPTGVTAARASAFLSSLGVCTHIAQGIDDPDGVATALTFAGIHAIRDDGNPSAVQGWITVFQKSGARTNMLPNGDIPTTIAMAKQLNAAGALLSVEGPNEPNNFPVTYLGQTSSYASTFAPVADFQRDLYAAVKAEPALADVPVFHASEAGGSEPDDVGLQFLTVPPGAGTTVPAGTKYADYANTHNYVCGHSSQLVDNVCWNAEDPTLNGDWDGLYVEYGKTWHGGFAGYSNADLATLPRVTTETGWVTSGTGAITQEQQARLFLNLYLAAYARGWSYTFIYMLRDDPGQGYWGLFDTGWTPKTSGTYLHNLTTILADSGATGSAPGKLDYAIASPPSTVHDLLLQKSDGTFELVVWNERPSGGQDAITVDLKTPRANVTLYDPTTGTAPVQTLTNVSSVPLTLSDHPNVLEL